MGAICSCVVFLKNPIFYTYMWPTYCVSTCLVPYTLVLPSLYLIHVFIFLCIRWLPPHHFMEIESVINIKYCHGLVVLYIVQGNSISLCIFFFKEGWCSFFLMRGSKLLARVKLMSQLTTIILSLNVLEFDVFFRTSLHICTMKRNKKVQLVSRSTQQLSSL